MHTQGRTLCFYELLEPSKKKYASRRTLFLESSWRIVPPRRPFHPYTVTACSTPSAAFFPFSSSAFLFALSYHCPSIPGGPPDQQIDTSSARVKRFSKIYFLEDPKPSLLIRLDTCWT